jgi:hypothetical protein
MLEMTYVLKAILGHSVRFVIFMELNGERPIVAQINLHAENAHKQKVTLWL